MKKYLIVAIVTGLLFANLAYTYYQENEELKSKVTEQSKLIKQQVNTNIEASETIKQLQEQFDYINQQLSEKEREIEELEKLTIITAQASAYISTCKGCSGTTLSGYNVTNTIHYGKYRIIAADINLIPLHSIVEVKTKDETFEAIVLDSGGLIKFNSIDLLVSTYQEAVRFGRQTVTIRMIRKGKGQ